MSKMSDLHYRLSAGEPLTPEQVLYVAAERQRCHSLVKCWGCCLMVEPTIVTAWQANPGHNIWVEVCPRCYKDLTA